MNDQDLKELQKMFDDALTTGKLTGVIEGCVYCVELNIMTKAEFFEKVSEAFKEYKKEKQGGRN